MNDKMLEPPQSEASRVFKEKTERRERMKALMSSSRRLSKECGQWKCSKCGSVVGSEAALQNHVSLHTKNFTKCPYCDFQTDFITQRSVAVKHVSIVHGEFEGQPGRVHTEYEHVPIEIGHKCNERIKRRHVDNKGYHSSKK